MPVSLSEMRKALLPGLIGDRYSYAGLRQWDHLFDAPMVAQLPEITVGPITMAGMAAMAVVIQNPPVSRRGMFAWFGA